VVCFSYIVSLNYTDCMFYLYLYLFWMFFYFQCYQITE